MNFNIYQKVCITLFTIFAAFWGILFFNDIEGTSYNTLYVLLYGLVPLFGGIIVIKNHAAWAGLSSTLKKALLFLGLGMFLWGCGEVVWAFYGFWFNNEVPYPSLADLFFVPSVFLYTTGTIFLSLTTGARIGFKNAGGKIFAAISFISACIATYYIMIVIGHRGFFLTDTSSIIKSILDILYPLGDAISLAVSLVILGLSWRYMNGAYRHNIVFIVLGLMALFVGDSYISYSTTIGASYNGDLGDIFFTLSVISLTCGVLGFARPKIKEIKYTAQ